MHAHHGGVFTRVDVERAGVGAGDHDTRKTLYTLTVRYGDGVDAEVDDKLGGTGGKDAFRRVGGTVRNAPQVVDAVAQGHRRGLTDITHLPLLCQLATGQSGRRRTVRPKATLVAIPASRAMPM